MNSYKKHTRLQDHTLSLNYSITKYGNKINYIKNE